MDDWDEYKFFKGIEDGETFIECNMKRKVEHFQNLLDDIKMAEMKLEELRKIDDDGRAENAFKFAMMMGDLYSRYPENVVTAMSYAVWAYLGGEKRPEVGE